MTIDATNRRSLWHFSLGSLLLLTAAIALLVWLYTQQWRLDELIFIVLWMACVVAGVVHSRRGGWGVSLSLIAGAIVPVSGFLAYHLYLYFIRRMGVQTEAFYLITLQVTAYGTAFSAALVVAAVVLFDRQSPNVRKRIKLAAGLALIGFAVLIVGLRIRHDQRSWHPILTLPIGGIDNASPAPPPIAFTPDGSLMAIVSPSPDGKAKQLRIWELATLTERPPFGLAEQVVSSICFAPDGKQIAVVRPDGISIYDTATGKLAKSIDELTANPWIPRNCRCWHGTLKCECIRPAAPASLEEARRRVAEYVEHYNHVRLNGAIGYLTPADKLNGLAQVIFDERDRKLEEARQRRQQARQAAREVA